MGELLKSLRARNDGASLSDSMASHGDLDSRSVKVEGQMLSSSLGVLLGTA